MRTVALAMAMVAALGGCGGFPSEPGEVQLAPEPARRGLGGRDGAHGVARTRVTVTVRVTESLVVEVHHPATAEGGLDRTAAPYPAVVLLQGGLVSTERYRWLAVHLASRGYVVATPEHPLDLAILETDNGRLALTALRRAALGRGVLAGSVAVDGLTAVLGHSLGGVVGGRLWLGGSFHALGLLAAYPATGDDLSRGNGRPVLALVGGNDRSATVTEVATGLRRFGSPRWLAVVDDLNHYDWTDGATASELMDDGPPARDQALTRRHALAALDTWLDAVLKRLPEAEEALRAPSLPGVTVTR